MAKVKASDITVVRDLPDGLKVGISKGSKPQSPHDFRVHFKWAKKGAQWRTPTHVHLIVDMYSKRMGNPSLTRRFVDYILEELIGEATPATSFPPDVPEIDEVVSRFTPLNAFGEYSVEFIVTVEGLIAASERTNYGPSGHLQRDLWQAFRDGEEIFRVLSIALT
jgi:hypothetical protein